MIVYSNAMYTMYSDMYTAMYSDMYTDTRDSLLYLLI